MQNTDNKKNNRPKWDKDRNREYQKERQRMVYSKYLLYEDMKTKYDKLFNDYTTLINNYNDLVKKQKQLEIQLAKLRII